jgi:hypothetical protein
MSTCGTPQDRVLSNYNCTDCVGISHKPGIKLWKPDTKEYIPCDCLDMKFKNSQNCATGNPDSGYPE